MTSRGWVVGQISLGPSGCTTSYSACATVTDAFNRADAGDGTLGFADTGQRWLNAGGVFEASGDWTTQGTTVNTAQAIAPDLTAYHFMATSLDAGGNNQDATADGEAGDDDSIGLLVRCSADMLNGYHFFPNAYGSGSFFKFQNGVSTLLLSVGPLVSPNTPFTARAQIKDNVFKGWVNGSLVGTITVDPDDAGGNCETDWTYCGFREDHGGPGGSAPSQLTVYANTHWDNLSVVAP